MAGMNPRHSVSSHIHCAVNGERGVTTVRRAARTCESCGARLARDRMSDHCGSCTRRLISHVAQPQPETFWEADSIRTALKARHFGWFFAAYRQEHKPHVSQAALGLWSTSRKRR
jgi:hypothetical protein